MLQSSVGKVHQGLFIQVRIDLNECGGHSQKRKEGEVMKGQLEAIVDLFQHVRTSGILSAFDLEVPAEIIWSQPQCENVLHAFSLCLDTSPMGNPPFIFG